MKKIILLSFLTSVTLFADTLVSPYADPVDIPLVNNLLLGIPMGVALLGGEKSDIASKEWETLYGLEFSFECLFSKQIISQIQLTHYDMDDLSVFDISTNPHYLFYISESMALGVGPSLGVQRLATDHKNDLIFSYGAGASLRVNISDDFFVGLESHYIWTSETKFKDVYDEKHIHSFAKLGYQF